MPNIIYGNGCINDGLYPSDHVQKLIFQILSIENNEVHILCEGMAIIDGYAEPYETASFEID